MDPSCPARSNQNRSGGTARGKSNRGYTGRQMNNVQASEQTVNGSVIYFKVCVNGNDHIALYDPGSAISAIGYKKNQAIHGCKIVQNFGLHNAESHIVYILCIT